MFTSRRHLVNNYLETFNLKDKHLDKVIHKEGKNYPIYDTKDGTTVYSDYILNILDEDFLDDFYGVFNPIFIDKKDFKKVLENNSYFPYEHGFLEKETIYKVKDHE